MYKGYTGTDSDAMLQWKLVKFYLISTDIGTKFGTETIGIRIAIGVGSVETVLHIIIQSIYIGIGIGTGVGQCKYTTHKSTSGPESGVRRAASRSVWKSVSIQFHGKFKSTFGTGLFSQV